MYCYKCGFKLTDGSVYCERCGSKVSAEPSQIQSSNESQSAFGNDYGHKPYVQQNVGYTDLGSQDIINDYQSKREFITKSYDWRIVRLRKILTFLSVTMAIICVWATVQHCSNIIHEMWFFENYESYTYHYEETMSLLKLELTLLFIMEPTVMLLIVLGQRYKSYGFYIAIMFLIASPPLPGFWKILAMIIVFAASFSALVVSIMMHREYKKYREAQYYARRQMQK